MFSFKLWLEIVDQQKPQSKVIRKNVIKDKGTNVARKIIEFSYNTKLGNNIKLQFSPKGDDSYDVVFYVNDTLYDFAPRMGADLKDEKYQRDTEILPIVFYLLKTKADKLNAKQLTFSAHASDRDTKIVRNLDVNAPKEATLASLAKFENEVRAFQPQLIEPSQRTIDLYKKLNKQIIPQQNFNKDSWMQWISEVKLAINNLNNYKLEEQINTLIGQQHIGKMPLDVNDLINNLKILNNAIASNTESGYKRTINRRASIYKKILDRDFAQNWDINMTGNKFTLNRKNLY